MLHLEVWERIIQTAKRTLLIILGNQQLKAEFFQTIVTETEGILNSHAITYVSSDNNNEKALISNHFILRRPHRASAPSHSEFENLQEERFPLYTNALGPLLQRLQGVHFRVHFRVLLQRLKRVHFRVNFKREYTPDLIKAICRGQSKQLKAGDLVWIQNEFIPRGIWPLGLITKCHYGADEMTRLFDVHTTKRKLIRPAVNLSRVIDEEEEGITRSAATNPTQIPNIIRIITKWFTSSSPGNQLFNIIQLY